MDEKREYTDKQKRYTPEDIDIEDAPEPTDVDETQEAGDAIIEEEPK